MPELPETSALLQVHPACVSVDKKRDAKYLEVLVLPSYQCCESQQLHLQFRLYRLINRVTRVCSALTKYLFIWPVWSGVFCTWQIQNMT